MRQAPHLRAAVAQHVGPSALHQPTRHACHVHVRRTSHISHPHLTSTSPTSPHPPRTHGASRRALALLSGRPLPSPGGGRPLPLPRHRPPRAARRFGLVGGEGPRLLEAEWRQRGVMLYLLSCVFGIAISFTGWRCRALVSATCYTVLGVANKMLTVLANIIVWDDHASPAAKAVQEWPRPQPAPRRLCNPRHAPARPPYAPHAAPGTPRNSGSGRATAGPRTPPTLTPTRSPPPAPRCRPGSPALSAACVVRPPTAPRRCGAPSMSTTRRALQTPAAFYGLRALRPPATCLAAPRTPSHTSPSLTPRPPILASGAPSADVPCVAPHLIPGYCPPWGGGACPS